MDIGAGIWLAKNNGKTPQYYYRFDGSGNGERRSQEDGEEKPFTYSVNGSTLTIQYKWDDNPIDISVTDNGDGSMEFVGANGRSQTLRYLGGFGFDWFTFYTNKELLDMAQAYYANRNSGKTFSDQLSAYILDDDMIRIELINFSSSGEPEDAAIFTIDRYTAKGTHTTGSGEVPVDLADMQYETVTPAPWSPDVTARDEMTGEEKHIGVMYLGVPLVKSGYGPGDPMFATDLHYNGAEEKFPCVTELPADRFICTVRGREMFLIVPADKEASVTVREILYDNETYSEYPDDTLYSSSDGAPFVIVCNSDRRRCDVMITVTESDGTTYEWYPWVDHPENSDVYANSINDYDGTIKDFTDYPKVNGEDDPDARIR